MASLRVHTAQNVTLEYEVASLGDRILAVIIDNLVLVAWAGLWLGVLAVTFGPEKMGNSPLVISLLVLLIGVPYVFYNLISEVLLNGQSIGKKARHIRVMRLDGTAPRLGDYMLRWLMRLIDTGLPVVGGMVAIITIAANGRGQRLGDMAAGTTVVSTKPRRPTASPLTSPPVPAGYVVVFPQAALLADHDVALVRQLLRQAQLRQDFTLLNEIANKVKTITSIRTGLQDEPFLQTVLRDHTFLASQV